MDLQVVLGVASLGERVEQSWTKTFFKSELCPLTVPHCHGIKGSFRIQLISKQYITAFVVTGYSDYLLFICHSLLPNSLFHESTNTLIHELID